MSLLALIEKRFLSDLKRPHLTKRDADASDLEDLFDFKSSPSLNTNIGTAIWPQNDCTPAAKSNESAKGAQSPSGTLNANRSLDFFFESELVGLKLPWINLQFCYPANRASNGFGSGTSLRAKQE